MTLLPLGAVAGVLATLGMDVVAFVAVKAGAPKPPHLQYIGRWFLYVMRGQLSHHTIAEAPPLAGESLAMPVGHYLIGAALGVAFTLFLSAMPERVWTAGLAFGVITCALPWLFMFPSMGFGLFGMHGPAGSKLLFMPIPGHLVYGLCVAGSIALFRQTL
jgi:ABC-type phosphate transport system permease subunit